MLRCAASALAVVRSGELLNAMALRSRTKSTLGKPAAATRNEKASMTAAPARPAEMAFGSETTRIIRAEARRAGQLVDAGNRSSSKNRCGCGALPAPSGHLQN